MYNMLNFIPDDMGEVQQKLFWLKANGYPDTTEHEVIEKNRLQNLSVFCENRNGVYALATTRAFAGRGQF